MSMFTATPVPTSLSTTTASSAVSPPTSPTRTSRLRGLSYLRNYTQNLHGRTDSDSSTRPTTRPAFPRARSQPSPEHRSDQQPTPISARAAARPQPQPQPQPLRRAPSPPSTTAGQPQTNGWVPSGNTSDGTRGAGIRQQNTSDETPSSRPAPTVTTAESTPARPMTRSRADTAGAVLTIRGQGGPRTANADADNAAAAGGNTPTPSIRFIPHFDPRANRPSLSFPAVTRTLPQSTSIIKVGRYSERENMPEIPANTPSSAPVGFKSKVVSRRHCEFWCSNSQWYIKDVKSSSGTFLNHVRLSPPGQESKAFAVNDGDVVQLGIDFRGGEEMIFRCVKIRIECNRGWQKHLNNFNKKTHKQLLARQRGTQAAGASARDSDTASVNSSECSICLMSIAPCQSLFVAPCSHVWHYKCIRPILNGHTWPNFLCPNCRAVADLEADVDEQSEGEEADWEEEDGIAEAIEASQAAAGSSRGLQVVNEPEGLRTPRAMQPSDANSDDELAQLALNGLRLEQTHTRTEDSTSSEEDEHPTQIGDEGSNIPPRDIPTPSGIRRYELTPGALLTEAVLTPRNDVGPFVLDGGADRNSTGAVPVSRSLDAAASAVPTTRAT